MRNENENEAMRIERGECAKLVREIAVDKPEAVSAAFLVGYECAIARVGFAIACRGTNAEAAS